jgi:hypothetical protein
MVTSLRAVLQATDMDSLHSASSLSFILFAPFNAKHRMLCGFPLKIGEWGLWGHIKVWREKWHHLIAREKLLEDRCGISCHKLDDSNRFGATPVCELRLTRGTEIVHPVHLAKHCYQPTGVIPLNQCYRGGIHLPTLASSNRKKHQGTERQTSTQQSGEHGGSDPHAAGHLKRFCHTTPSLPCFADALRSILETYLWLT